jgi:hypothetical protein
MTNTATRRTFLSVVALIFLACGVAAAKTQSAAKGHAPRATQSVSTNKARYFRHLRAAHREIVEQWLQSRPEWRPAIEADCRNKAVLGMLRADGGAQYHPYYVVADFNRDGHEDFALALYNSRRPAKSRFAIMIFNGTTQGNESNPAYFKAGVDLRSGGMWTSEIEETQNWLIAGEPETDNCSFFRPQARSYLAVGCESGDPAAR